MKKYWQSFGELNQSESFNESATKEFKEELLPLEELDGKGILEVKTPRRDFLKYLGFNSIRDFLCYWFAKAFYGLLYESIKS